MKDIISSLMLMQYSGLIQKTRYEGYRTAIQSPVSLHLMKSGNWKKNHLCKSAAIGCLVNGNMMPIEMAGEAYKSKQNAN
jgi:hypothetical protein